MQRIEINDHVINVFAAAEELPISRYAKFQKYALIEAGLGSDLKSIGSHFGKLFEYLTQKMNEEALQETKNLYYNIHLIMEEINVESLAFACLIHSIDGKEVIDTSEEGLKLTVAQLSEIGLTKKMVDENNQSVKKKSMIN